MSHSHPMPQVRETARRWAQSLFALDNFYVIDTETTGVGKHDEVVQIGVIDKHGTVIMDTLVRPTIRVPQGAINVHGISNEMLTDAPTFADIYTDLSAKLAGSHLIAYNMDFDWRLLTQSKARYRLPAIRTKNRDCAMKQYAQYRGVYGRYGKFRWHKLGDAAAYEQIEVKNAHSALGDVIMTLALMQKMAES